MQLKADKSRPFALCSLAHIAYTQRLPNGLFGLFTENCKSASIAAARTVSASAPSAVLLFCLLRVFRFSVFSAVIENGNNNNKNNNNCEKGNAGKPIENARKRRRF